ncbi:uncharacterized protein CXQ87_003132 [Candidozyma duobushaemuli]|uniref:Uncharacterized protein n=1 Tax=Candidozyma duobushaemuli TaxID=1231522 RepID=A0A2V1ACN7_9ASCO|nr:uncharacterized protein CXQ87_003132 [[Candida] duobushaemulonis]PVH15294.1 hypothetical protein CXQ87_003132 [[Candida] duobushaemulonis]
MSTLGNTYVACCLHMLQDPACPLVVPDPADFVSVLDTLDLSSANLALSIVLLARYKENSVNTLSLGDTSAVATAYYAMIASLVLANKYMNDQSYTLKTWHSILGKCSRLAPSLPFLNQLESHFLSALNFSLRSQVEENYPVPLPPVPAVAPVASAAAAAPPPTVMPTPPTFPFAPVVMAPVVSPAYCLGQPHMHCTPVPTPPTVPPAMPRGYSQAFEEYMPMTPMSVGRKRRKVDECLVRQPWTGKHY